MGRQILVNASPYETRVATLEDGEIKQLHIEREEDRNVVGNIYKGVVKRVLPGMQAAFLELGLERTAFLYVDDIIEDPLGADVEYEDEGGEGEDREEGEPRDARDDDDEENLDDDDDDRGEDDEDHEGLDHDHAEGEGEEEENFNRVDANKNERPRRVREERAPRREVEEDPDVREAREDREQREERDSNRGSGSDAPKPPRRPSKDRAEHRREGGGGRGGQRSPRGGRGGRGGGGARGGRRNFGRRPKRQVQIQDLIKEGEELLVQVAKAPIGTKGARLTTHVSIPGRNLVLMPTSKHIGISRRIESDRERRRLREIFLKRIQPEGVGFIVRTVAAGKSFRDLKADADYLLNVWDKVRKGSTKAKAPAIIHEDLPLSLRSVRDFLTDDVDSFIIDNQEAYDQVLDFISQFMPRLKNRVKLFKGPSQLFEHYGIEAEISRALGRKVWLKSGGYLLIDQSEALTSIDVNTGRYVGSKSLEETILKTNLEAVKEISYQLRIRNIGGIIIMDLIDMENQENKEKVFRALHEALAEDKAKTNILKISELGLVEMTRKRTHEDLVRSLTEGCGYCEGRGYHKSKRTICFEIFREIEKEALAENNTVVVFASPEVTDTLLEDEAHQLDLLEERFKKGITVKTDTGFHIEQYEVFGKQ